MCGIAGFFDYCRTTPTAGLETFAGRMADALGHRGPDDSGVWTDEALGIALAHRRLAIVDLSAQGHQPMLSADSRFVLVFNGEIYNFADLRSELEGFGHSFRGHSDTEVMLASFQQWGVESSLPRLVGMFAFAVWDRANRTLHLACDRMGEKPLYYGWADRVFLFGSELKALRAHSSWLAQVDRNSLALFFRHNYIPAPHSIYRGIRKLIPGTCLHLKVEELGPCELREPAPYWSAKSAAEAGAANPFGGSESEAISVLETLLRRAVLQQMVADVPVGAFLSGGIDSSVIVALAQAQSRRPVRTFTIGFNEVDYDEARHAKGVAKHLGTDHTELYVTSKEALSVIPRLPEIFDEPFADSSQIPTFLLASLARRHVTVSLSGDAGDELFGGYSRYPLAKAVWRRVGWMPRRARRALAACLRAIKVETWERCLARLRWFSADPAWCGRVGDRLHKFAELLPAATPYELYRGLVSHWKNAGKLVIGANEPETVLNDPSNWALLPEIFHRLMFLDTVSYLPGDILVKVDRASMAVGLESRIPLLDHRVVEFAWQLPLAMKFRFGQGKWLLRQLLYKYVPRDLVERPKMGFGIPLGEWLRGPLRGWSEDLLNAGRLKREGFLDPVLVRTKWEEHLSGRRNWQYHLWVVLMFESWLAAQGTSVR